MFRSEVLLLVASLAASTAVCAGDLARKTYAQELVDTIVASDRDLLVAAMHVTPPGSDQNVIIASNIGRIGKPGDEDDLGVIQSGKARVELSHDGQRLEVELPIYDSAHTTVGALGLVWKHRAGEDDSAFERRAGKIRDALARRILSASNLTDPYPFVATATTKTYAQKLVNESAAKHREVGVLALRGPVKGEDGLVVLGSTFGRHGKKADADDLRIFKSEEPATGVYSGGKRFGVDLQLHDAKGRVIGTMNVGYAFHEGDERKALLAQALALREEIQGRIPSAESLQELDP
ncbi:MAG TPA: hypothetical protein VFE23_06455 [Usitatibacter sp.]|jgi:hypothetical protein|nr:hypothetical protein [Usitatibacter sp.]